MSDLQFIHGYPNDFKAYQIATRETRTYTEKITPNKFGGGIWVFSTIVELTIVVRRERDNFIAPQLGNIEREIMKRVGQYKPDDIPGIDQLLYIYHDRVYDFNQGYATTRWVTKIYLEVKYSKVNIEAHAELT